MGLLEFVVRNAYRGALRWPSQDTSPNLASSLPSSVPRKLFYTGKKDIYQDAMAEDAFLEMLAEGGYQVGALAKLRYPEGIEIHETDHAAAEAATQALLARDHVVLFEPAIRVGNFFIRIDVLVKDGNRFELIEVKAKSYNSVKPELFGARGGIRLDMLPYFQDAAFQDVGLATGLPGRVDPHLPDDAGQSPGRPNCGDQPDVPDPAQPRGGNYDPARR